MAGVRRLPSGSIQGWYRDAVGKRRYFTLGKDASKSEVRKAARALEADSNKVRLGYQPARKAH